MKKLKLFFACLLMAVLSIGQMWGAQTLVAVSASDLEDGDYMITATKSSSEYYLTANAFAKGAANTAAVLSSSAYSNVWSFAQQSNGTWLVTLSSGEGLGVTATNNGVICATDKGTAFTISETAANATTVYMVANDGSDDRYLTLYQTSNWRCYKTSTNANADQVREIQLYKVEETSTTISVTGVTLDQSEAEIEVGGTVTLTPTIVPSNATTKTVTWESSDDAVATVANGVVTGVAEGTATITVKTTDGNKTATCNVTVTAATPAPTDDADVVLDLLDGNWGLPTSGTNTELATFTNSVTGYAIKCSAATNYKVGSDYLIIGKANSYIELPTFSSPVEKIVVVKGNGSQPSTSVVFNIYDGNDAVSTAATGCATDKEFEIENPAANKTYTLKITSGHNLQLSAIKIYFGEAPDVAKPTISGETPFLNTTSVSISIPEGTTVYYTTDGSDPKTSDTKQTYSAAFNLSANATVKAIATDGANWSEPVEKSFVKATVMTVAQARAAIDAGGDLTNKFVAGIISQIDSYQSNYHSITYWISDDGTTTDQLEVYSGLAGVVKAQFESVNDLAVGDDVTVKGTLKKYQSTYEFDYNNTIEAYKPIARLAWSAESYDASLEGTNTFPSLTNTNDVTVSYSSSDPTKASFADASVYEITLNAAGSTTITATFAGNETYKANSVSYTLNVASSLVTLTYNVDGGEAIDPVNVSALPNPLPTTTKAGKNFGGWFTDPEKTVGAVAGAAITENTTLYAKWLDPYTVAEAKTVIDANPDGIANQYVAGIISQIDSYNNTYKSITYWISADGATTNQLQVYSGKIGNAATALGKDDFSAKEDLELGDEVVVTGTLKFHNNTTYEFDKNNSIYTFSRKESAGLEYAVTAVNKVVGDADFVNELTNPNGVAVTYGTSDDQVAEVANDGTVKIIGEGTATISATFVGTPTYKAAVVSYTLTVSAAAQVLTDYYEKVTETAGITDGTYLIVYEAGNVAFNGGLETLDAESNTIDVVITNDHKIGVTEATAAATFFIDVTAGSIQAANGSKYIGVSSYGNGLKTSETSDYSHTFAIDGEGNAIIGIYGATWNKGGEGTMILNYNSASNQARFRYYKEGGQQAIQLYKLANETVKEDPQLTWSAESVTITVGDEFIAPTLSHKEGFTGTITFASDNESLATVSSVGAISLEAEATGTAHITASFAGDDTYKAVNVACTITVNAAAPVPAGTDNVVILAVYDEKYYAMSTNNANNGFTAIAVEYDGSQVTVKSEAEKAAIQWTRTTTDENTTFQDAESKYMKSADGASMSLQEAVCNWVWDATEGYYKIAGTSRTFFFQNTSGGIFKNYATTNLDGSGYSGKAQVIVIDPANIVITSKVSAELAYDPESDEIAQGDAWSAPTLGYVEGFDGLEAITYESSNEAVATVTDAGAIALAGGTGTATITATFAGNASYLAGSATYTVKVNEPADVCDGTDDFLDTEDKGNPTSYTDRSTPNGWSAVNAGYKVIEEKAYWMINGKTTAVGVITSPELTGGLGSLKFRYANTNSESNGVSVKIEIKQGGDVVKEYTLTKPNSDVVQNTVYTELIENINVEGTFQIVITNLSPSNNTGNKDRVSIGRFCWSNYSAPEPPTPVYTEVRGGLTAGNYYTICLPKKVTAIKGATFWNLKNRNSAGTEVYLEEAGLPFAAGTPFIINATADKLEVVYEGDAVTDSVPSGALRGTLSGLNIAQFDALPGNIYILKNNAIQQRLTGQNYLGANRAYILYNELVEVTETPLPAPGRRVVAMPMQKDQAQGFENLDASEKPLKVMIDGTLYILRGEKVYDATGRLVK